MTYLSTRIRAIATDPSPANIAELPKLALMVGRMERTLDEIVADAMDDAATIRSSAQVIEIGNGRIRRFS